jgi:hypothetical protein
MKLSTLRAKPTIKSRVIWSTKENLASQMTSPRAMLMEPTR